VKRALFALTLLLPSNAAEYRARILDAKCDTLCPLIRKGDEGRGRSDGKCECINVVDPDYYRDQLLDMPKRLKAPTTYAE
jgi:hypothetical protein